MTAGILPAILDHLTTVESTAARLLQSMPNLSQSSSPSGWVLSLLVLYCLCVVAASLAGGWLPTVVRLTHTRLQTVISFVGGLMLGIGVFHMLPHAVDALGSATLTGRWMMVGIAMTFVTLRLFHFHNHEPVTLATSKEVHGCDHEHDDGHDMSVKTLAQKECDGKDHTAAECHAVGHAHGVSWMGIALGLSLHSLFDGIALAASVQVEANKATSTMFLGLGTFLAVMLHKPLDAVSITALMVSEGWKRRTIGWVNAGFALMCPLGAALFLMGIRQFPGVQTQLMGTSLAFACGIFVCISLSDLLPEMEFHAHNKVQLTVALTSGILLAWLLTLLETSHMH